MSQASLCWFASGMTNSKMSYVCSVGRHSEGWISPILNQCASIPSKESKPLQSTLRKPIHSNFPKCYYYYYYALHQAASYGVSYSVIPRAWLFLVAFSHSMIGASDASICSKDYFLQDEKLVPWLLNALLALVT